MTSEIKREDVICLKAKIYKILLDISLEKLTMDDLNLMNCLVRDREFDAITAELKKKEI